MVNTSNFFENQVPVEGTKKKRRALESINSKNNTYPNNNKQSQNENSVGNRNSSQATELQKKAKETNEKLESEVNALSEQLNELNKENQDLRRIVVTGRKRNDELIYEIKKLNENFENVKTENATLKRKLSDCEATSSEAEVQFRENLEKEVKQKETELNEKCEMISNLESELKCERERLNVTKNRMKTRLDVDDFHFLEDYVYIAKLEGQLDKSEEEKRNFRESGEEKDLIITEKEEKLEQAMLTTKAQERMFDESQAKILRLEEELENVQWFINNVKVSSKFKGTENNSICLNELKELNEHVNKKMVANHKFCEFMEKKSGNHSTLKTNVPSSTSQISPIISNENHSGSSQQLLMSDANLSLNIRDSSQPSISVKPKQNLNPFPRVPKKILKNKIMKKSNFQSQQKRLHGNTKLVNAFVYSCRFCGQVFVTQKQYKCHTCLKISSTCRHEIMGAEVIVQKDTNVSVETAPQGSSTVPPLLVYLAEFQNEEVNCFDLVDSPDVLPPKNENKEEPGNSETAMPVTLETTSVRILERRNFSPRHAVDLSTEKKNSCICGVPYPNSEMLQRHIDCRSKN